MTEVDRITATLKRCLKERGMTYADLAKPLQLSEVSVKRMFSQRTFTMQRLEEICQCLQLDFYTLAKMARGDLTRLSFLSLEQEQALAKDVKLITVFHLVLHEWTPEQIGQDFDIGEHEMIRLLVKLERLKLIELLPHNRIRLRCPQHITWRQDGPVRTRYQEVAMREFLDSSFSGKDELIRLEVRELTAASIAVLRSKLERIAVEFNELGEIDSQASIAKRRSVGMTIAIRPWVFSIVSALRRKDIAQ